MLNISHNTVSEHIDLRTYKSGKTIFTKEYHKNFKRLLLVFLILILITLFLPWTQTIRSKGKVTTLKPNQRPQTVQSSIPGRIEKWFVQEGDFVKKGDTILRISEVKSAYFDEKLATRTSEQITAKNNSVISYKNKVTALKNQIVALQKERELKLKQTKNKLEQTRLKIKAENGNLDAIVTKATIAKTQFERIVALQKEGLKAVKDVETYRNKLQEANAKKIAQKNKILVLESELNNNELAIATLKATYGDKIAKAQSNLYSAESSALDTKVQVSKLQTSLANYQKRNTLLFITAPQDGYINKAIISGIGETFKAGEKLVGIMPANYELAVEMYVKPIDLPLIHKGEKVRVQFDGWPAIIFSGWPNVSYGTYGAEVVAIENFISKNGMYRVLIAPDSTTEKWPNALRVGSGAKTLTLLNNVPIFYEIWRQINSFPPNFYQPTTKEKQNNTAKENKKTKQ